MSNQPCLSGAYPVVLLGGFIERTVKPGAAIITDDWSGYAKLGIRGYCHTAVAERGDTQVAETFLPIIHLVFSNLNTWLRGIHHGVSPQHLQAYLNEFTFRFNRRIYPFNAFRSLLGIAGDVIAPTYAELYAKKHDPLLHLMALGANRIRAQRLCPETALAGLQDGAIAVTFFELKSCVQPVR